jgi:hypothetical protein
VADGDPDHRLRGSLCVGAVHIIHPPTDDKLISRLEPIVAVIVGYFFGRVPSFANEKQLARRAEEAEQKASASAGASERLKAVRDALAGGTEAAAWRSSDPQSPRGMKVLVNEDDEKLLDRIAAAVRILDGGGAA